MNKTLTISEKTVEYTDSGITDVLIDGVSIMDDLHQIQLDDLEERIYFHEKNKYRDGDIINRNKY